MTKTRITTIKTKTTTLLGSPSTRALLSLPALVLLLVLAAQTHTPALGAPLVVSVPFGQDPLPLIQNAFLSSSDVEVSFAPLSATGLDRWFLSSTLSLSGTQRLLLQRDSTVSNTTRIVLDCGDQGRAVVLSGSSTLALRDVFFENCTADDSEGGAILLRENTQLDVFRGGFTRNSAEFGGAISFQNSSRGTIFAAIFSSNQAVNRGGAIAAQNAASLRLLGCTFTQNNAERGGGMTALDESTVVISSSQFIGNRALYSGSLDPGGSAAVEFEDCRFENETVSNNGAVMEVTGRVAITYRSCVFQNNLPTQLTVRGADESLTSFYNCTFRFTSAVDDAAQAVHFWVFSPALYVGCSFYNSRSSEVGGALRAGALNITVIDTLFENNKAFSGGAVSFVRGYALFRRCSFKDNSARTAGGALQISTGEDVEVVIENCDFRGGEAVMGGAVSVESDAKVKVSRSEFRDNKANYGGAIALGYSAKVTIKSSEFRSNKARYGAGLYQTEDAVLAVEDTDFHDNGHSIKTDYGGALFVTKQAEQCPRFEGGSMSQNKAYYAGGGIYFESRTPPCASSARFASTVRFSRNSATYGKDFASAPAKLVLLESTLTSTLVPSQEFSSVLEVRDHFNQTLRGFIDMSVFLQARFEADRGYNTTLVQGTVVRQPTDKGLVNFVDIVFLAEEEKIDLKFTSDPQLKPETVTIEVEACDPDKDVLYRDDDGRLYCLRIRDPSELVIHLVYIAASIFTAVSVSAQILIVLLRNRCPIKTVGWHFLFLVGIGCELCIISVFMWTDVTDGMCSLRVWLLSLGLSVMFGSMLARLWMHRQNERAVKKLPVKIVNGYTIHPELLPRTTPLQALIGIGAALVPTLLVMTIWMIVDPPFRDEEIQLKDGDPLRHTMTPECRISSPSGIFAIVLIVIHGLLLVAGCVLSFTLRHLPSCFHESKITVFVMYNTLFVLVAAVILASIFHDDKTPLLIIVAVLILFACGVILLLVFGYKIYLSVLPDSRMISRLQDEITQLNIETVHSQMHIYSIDPVVKSNTLAASKSASIASGPIHSTGTGTGTDLSYSNN